MMKAVSVVLLLALVGTCFCREFVRLDTPRMWREVGRTDPNESVRLQIGLQQHNLDKVENYLLDVADPFSPNYGKWMSNEELATIIAPPVGDLDAVLSWLNENEIYSVDSTIKRDWVIAETTIGAVEALLGCEFHNYRNVKTGTTAKRAIGSYSIPDHLDDIVDFVAGVHGFPFGRWTPIIPNKPHMRSESRIGGLTPTDVYNLYSFTPLSSDCNCNTSQAVVEFSGANYSPSDLQSFFTAYVPNLKGQTVEQVYGTNNPDGLISTEANLDVQYIMAMGAFVNTSDYVQGINPNIIESFLDYTWVVGNQTDAPLVHSISWGEYGGQYDNQTVQRVNNEFMLMGVRGITVSLASGDNGVGCGDFCQSEEFDFPSSPYVTMVGATQESQSGGEVGADFSAGGFSKDYSTPSWQESAVTNYLNTAPDLPPPSSYYAGGRAYPDVSAIGVDIEVYVNGRSEPVDGTSCAAPIFAGIIATINAQRALQGKGPMGYLNPWIYSNPSIWNDITSGDNSYICCQGFKATAGWDPVTGMGTPNYPAMLQNALALP